MITNTHLGIEGQLGNQIFQYAALLGISERLGLEMKIPPLAQHKLGHLFRITADIYTAQDLRSLRHRFEESTNGFDPAWPSITDRTDLYGYFQSPRYFPAEERLRSELRFLAEIEDAAAAAMATLRSHRPVVAAITVRRGDYLINDEFCDLTATDYYDRALDVLDRELERFGVNRGDVVFAVSSDDPSWCRQRFAGENFVTIDEVGGRALSDHVQLALLSRCDHLVIANSTYSWWAAWLDEAPDKVVVAADQWFTHGGAYPDSGREPLPPGWLSVAFSESDVPV